MSELFVLYHNFMSEFYTYIHNFMSEFPTYIYTYEQIAYITTNATSHHKILYLSTTKKHADDCVIFVMTASIA